MPYKTNSPQNMNAKNFHFYFLILVAVACTKPLHLFGTRRSEALEQCPSTNQCLTTRKQSATNVGSCQTDLARNPGIGRKNGTTDTLIYYARKIFNACRNNYINTKQYKDGIDYMDSIGNHPLIREHCPHELLSFKAGLNQLYGNNRKLSDWQKTTSSYRSVPVPMTLSGRQKS